MAEASLSQDQLNQYLTEKAINPFFVQIVEAMLIEQPDNIVKFTFEYLLAKYPDDCAVPTSAAAAAAPAPAEAATDEAKEEDAEYSDTDEEGDDAGEMEEFVPVVRKNVRKGSIMSASVTVDANWKAPVFPKSADQSSMLLGRVKGIFFLQKLSAKDMDTLVGAFQLKEYSVGDVLMKQGDEGDCFFVLEEGKTDVLVNDTKVAEKDGQGENNFVGELALLYNAPRSATIVASTPVTAWALDRTTFKTIMQDSATKQSNTYQGFLEKVPLLKNLSSKEKQQLADCLKTKTYQADDVIIREGDEGDDFYIVEEGEVICTKTRGGDELIVSDKMGTGQFFGELALMNNDKRAASVKALTQVTCLTVDRPTFKRVLGPLTDILKQQQQVYAAKG